jgi:hypothetical protein
VEEGRPEPPSLLKAM